MEPLRPADPKKVGDYQVLARLGSGGMGQMFLGRSAGGRTVAIKVVHPAYAGDPEFRARFAREVVAARAVSGAFTAPVIDADTDAPVPWLVTAYLPGYSLDQVVSGSGPLPPWSVAALGAGLAEALVSIHGAGVVHRDLKPSNVLLTPEGPRVIDFGIARAAEVSSVTRTGVAVGSPGYLSPEQATGAESGPAGDVFSLGAVLTFAATGHGPFGFGAVHDLLYRVVHQPPWLDGVEPMLCELVARCLDKDPARRPTPEEVLERLAALAPAAPYGVAWLPPAIAAEITRPIALPRAPRSGVGRRTVIFGAAGVVGAAALAGGVTLLGGGSKKAADGTWVFTPASREVTGGPVVSGGLVYATESFQTKGMVALDPRTGTQRWSTTDVQSPSAADPLHVVTVGRVVYTNGFKSFKAIDVSNGSSLWEVSNDMIAINPAPVVGGGLLFCGGTESSSGLVAYDGVSGQKRWAFNTGRSVQASPVFGGDTVYVVSSEGTVFAVTAATGQARWRHSFQSPTQVIPTQVEATPVLGGGLLFVITDDNALYALDAAGGSQKWKKDALGAPGGGPPALAVAGDALYVSDDSGAVSVFGAADGKLRWEHKFTGKGHHAASTLPVMNGRNALFFDNDTLFALDAATGVQRWQTGGLDATYELPVVAAGQVHFASLSAVVSIDSATGKVLRRRPAELVEHLAALGDTLFWADSYKVYAAKARG